MFFYLFDGPGAIIRSEQFECRFTAKDWIKWNQMSETKYAESN